LRDHWAKLQSLQVNTHAKHTKDEGCPHVKEDYRIQGEHSSPIVIAVFLKEAATREEKCDVQNFCDDVANGQCKNKA
jgi:hypothetical protein